MPFCPKCRFEYKEGVKVCPDCGVPLVDRLPDDTPKGMNYVPVRTLPSRLYAEMLQEALKKEGIPSIIKGDDVGIMLGSYSTTSPVEITICVPEEDVDRCEEIADQMLNHI